MYFAFWLILFMDNLNLKKGLFLFVQAVNVNNACIYYPFLLVQGLC